MKRKNLAIPLSGVGDELSDDFTGCRIQGHE
jgi:hypothetical protein